MAESGTTENTPPASGSTAVLDAPTTTVSEPPITSAKQAFETVSKKADAASSTASPTASAVTDGTTAGAKTPPDAAITKPVVSDTTPEHRIEAAVRNARTEMQRQIDDLKGKVGWAEGYKSDDVKQAVDLLKALASNPKAFYDQLGSELKGSDHQLPDPELVSQDGKKKAYSSEQVVSILQNFKAQIEQSIMGQLKPTVDFVTNGQHTAAQQEQTNRATQFAVKTLERMRTDYPGFKDHEAEIEAVYKAIVADPQKTADLGGYVAVLNHAYLQVWKEKVLPTLTGKTETAVLNDFKQKANASNGSVVPGSGATKAVKAPTNVRELAELMRQNAAAAGAA